MFAMFALGPMSNAHFLPVSRYAVLPRRHLVSRALQGDPALVLLCGRPGSGKTVVAAQLATELAGRGEHVVWVRLTADDGEYLLFWRRLLGALVEAGVAIEGSFAQRLLGEEPRIRDPEALSRAFRECPQPLTLAVDDLHHLQGSDLDEVSESMLRVLEGVSGLRLIAMTRRPAPQLTGVAARVRVPVIELREGDLAFAASDVERLLGTRLPQLGNDRVRNLTESVMRESAGWPIAAHAAIVEYEIESVGRSVAARGSYIRGYADRILAGCDPEEREALIVSGLLPEVSPRVLAAMLGTSIARAQQMLDASPGADLLYWEDEQGERWYRHHDLVREELAGRAERELGTARLRACHREAAVTLIDTHPFEAVRSALRAQAWEILSDMLLDSHVLMTRSQPGTRLSPWLKDIPASARSRYPVLAVFALIDEYSAPGGRSRKVLRDLETLASHDLASESEKEGLPGATAAVLRMVAARLSGNEGLAVAMAERAQSIVDELAEEHAQRYRGALALAATQRPITFLHADRFDEAEHALGWVEAAPEQFDDHSRAHAAALGAFGAALRGDIRLARRLIERCEQIDSAGGWHDGHASSGYRIAAAIEALERGDDAVAQDHVTALGEVRETIEHWPHILVVETLIRDMRSGPAEALAYLDWQLARSRRRAVLPIARAKFAKIRARLGWHAGRVVPRNRKRPHESLETVYHALGRGEPATARAVVGRLLRAPGIAEHPREWTELLLLKAQAALLESDEQAAGSAARQAADLLETYQLGLPLRALTRSSIEQLKEFAPGLRAERGSTGSGRAISPLTAGEQRAITAIAVHGSVAAAAEALYLSPNTLKSQLRQAYRKLRASGRAEALRVAGDAGLIDEGLLG